MINRSLDRSNRDTRLKCISIYRRAYNIIIYNNVVVRTNVYNIFSYNKWICAAQNLIFRKYNAHVSRQQFSVCEGVYGSSF